MVKTQEQKNWKYFGHKIMGENSEHNQKLFYGVLRQLRKKESHKIRNIKIISKILRNKKEIMERWRQHFQELTLKHYRRGRRELYNAFIQKRRCTKDKKGISTKTARETAEHCKKASAK